MSVDGGDMKEGGVHDPHGVHEPEELAHLRFGDDVPPSALSTESFSEEFGRSETSTPPRVAMVKSAKDFMSNPNVLKAGLAERVKFLKQKGVTKQEIIEGLRQAGRQAEASVLESGAKLPSAPVPPPAQAASTPAAATALPQAPRGVIPPQNIQPGMMPGVPLQQFPPGYDPQIIQQQIYAHQMAQQQASSWSTLAKVAGVVGLIGVGAALSNYIGSYFSSPAEKETLELPSRVAHHHSGTPLESPESNEASSLLDEPVSDASLARLGSSGVVIEEVNEEPMPQDTPEDLELTKMIEKHRKELNAKDTLADERSELRDAIIAVGDQGKDLQSALDKLQKSVGRLVVNNPERVTLPQSSGGTPLPWQETKEGRKRLGDNVNYGSTSAPPTTVSTDPISTSSSSALAEAPTSNATIPPPSSSLGHVNSFGDSADTASPPQPPYMVNASPQPPSRSTTDSASTAAMSLDERKRDVATKFAFVKEHNSPEDFVQVSKNMNMYLKRALGGAPYHKISTSSGGSTGYGARVAQYPGAEDYLMASGFEKQSRFLKLTTTDLKELELSPKVQQLVEFSLSLLVPHVAQPPLQSAVPTPPRSTTPIPHAADHAPTGLVNVSSAIESASSAAASSSVPSSHSTPVHQPLNTTTLQPSAITPARPQQSFGSTQSVDQFPPAASTGNSAALPASAVQAPTSFAQFPATQDLSSSASSTLTPVYNMPVANDISTPPGPNPWSNYVASQAASQPRSYSPAPQQQTGTSLIPVLPQSAPQDQMAARAARLIGTDTPRGQQIQNLFSSIQSTGPPPDNNAINDKPIAPNMPLSTSTTQRPLKPWERAQPQVQQPMQPFGAQPLISQTPIMAPVADAPPVIPQPSE